MQRTLSGRVALFVLVLGLLVAASVWWTQGEAEGPQREPSPSVGVAQTDRGADPQQDPGEAGADETGPDETGPDETGPDETDTEEASPEGADTEGTDPASGLPLVDESDLPPEAADTLALIDAGGPYPYDEDDGVFGNFEGLLPDRERGHYREYTVDTPGLSHRGARRIVTGADGEAYWTDDHYSSFSRIVR